MTSVSNSPMNGVTIRAEVRKAFAFALWIKDYHGRPLDVTGCTFTLVVQPRRYDADTVPLLVLNGDIQSEHNGYVVFAIQSHDLDLKIEEYPYSIAMWTPDSYSSTIVKGELEVHDNTEYDSTTLTYDLEAPSTALEVIMKSGRAIEVRTGPNLAPGTTSFTNDDKTKLDSVEEGAQRHIRTDWTEPDPDKGGILNMPTFGDAAYMNPSDLGLPDGGSRGEVLMKKSSQPKDAVWAQLPSGGGGGNGLDATDIEEGKVPTATGGDTWAWMEPIGEVRSVNNLTGAVSLDTLNVPAAGDNLYFTSAERLKLATLEEDIDWNSVRDKPAFGTIALRDEVDFIEKGAVEAATDITGELPAANTVKLSELRGFSSGTALPSGGEDGDIYFQFI